MKRVSIFLTALVAVAFLTISWTVSNNNNAALRIAFDHCHFLDGDGGHAMAHGGNIVVTNSGNGNLKCTASGIPNSTGRAVIWNTDNTGGGLCFYHGQNGHMMTDQWQETVSANGNVVLQCRFRP